MGIFQFLSQNGCFHNKANPRTHTIMSGGTLYVPEDSYDEFLGIYAKEIQNGNRTLAFSELRSSQVFRMYFDVDILDTKALGEDFLLKLAKNMQETVVKFFPGVNQDTFKCVLCSTATKEVEPERVVKTFVKNGYHILFPFLNVTLDMALQLRFSVVRDLERNLGKRDVAVNPWSDVIDKAPYYNGLKMCGSVKSVTCSDCKGTKTNVRKKPVVRDIISQIRKLRKKLYPRVDNPSFDYSNVMTIAKDEFKNQDLAELYSRYQDETGFLMCPKCGDKGTHLEDRFYMPVSVLNGDGSVSEPDLDALNANMHEMMRWTSIRCRPSDEPVAGYFIPRGYSSPTPDRATGPLQVAGTYLERLSPGIYREAINSDMFLNDAIGIRSWKGREILDPRTLQLITQHVRSFHSEHKELDVRQVFEVKVARSSTRSKGKLNKALNNIVMANGVTSATDRVIELFSRVQVRVSGPGSRYCTNKGDEHTSNSVYFWISQEGMAQKCFSRKDTIGDTGKTCKEFRS
ncbi:unnamed protein product, partial [Sphacelaria rigidula]